MNPRRINIYDLISYRIIMDNFKWRENEKQKGKGFYTASWCKVSINIQPITKLSIPCLIRRPPHYRLHYSLVVDIIYPRHFVTSFSFISSDLSFIPFPRWSIKPYRLITSMNVALNQPVKTTEYKNGDTRGMRKNTGLNLAKKKNGMERREEQREREREEGKRGKKSLEPRAYLLLFGGSCKNRWHVRHSPSLANAKPYKIGGVPGQSRHKAITRPPRS